MSDDPELTPIIKTDYGKRTLADGREAPMLMVRYRCPKCKGVMILDAYRGIPGHTTCLDSLKRWTIMEPVSVIHPTRLTERPQDERAVEPEGWKGKPEVPAPDDAEFFRDVVWDEAREVNGGPLS